MNRIPLLSLRRAGAAALFVTALAIPAAAAAVRPQASAQAAPVPSPLQKALFEKMKVADAWMLTQGSPDILVGIVDSGFDFFHPALKGRLLPGYYAPGGYHTEIEGVVAHGTAIASLIVGRAAEMTGLAPGCRAVAAAHGLIEHILLKRQREWAASHPGAPLTDFLKSIAQSDEIKTFGRDWTTFTATGIADSIRYLVDRGVRVVNISGLLRLSLYPSDEIRERVQSAFRYAAGKGVLIVLSAGNNDVRSEDYPGDEASVLVVGASRLDDTRWHEETKMMGQTIRQGSNFGRRLGVMAPTDSIAIAVPHEARFYKADDGPMGAESGAFKKAVEVWPRGATSCAAPQASALAALVFSLRPDLDGAAVADLIKRGADDLGEKGYDIYTGWGRLNFARTLELARTAPRKG